MRISARYVGDPMHFYISYDALIQRPKIHLERMCDFINIDYLPSMTSPGEAFSLATRPHESWKARNTQPISPTPKSEKPSLPEADTAVIRTLTTPNDDYMKLLSVAN